MFLLKQLCRATQTAAPTPFSVKKKPSVTQARNMWGTENSVIDVDRTARSLLITVYPIDLCG
jgi:hypothetical protein